MADPAPGRFVTFEGGEGVGKSTQARMLAEALKMQGLAVVLTREPGGTPGAEAIRSLLLDPAGPGKGEGWSAPAEALLFAAARADHVDRLIRPALERGAWVVCDRFLDSSRAYQGGEGALTDAELLALHSIGSDGLLPDLTLLIEAPWNEVIRRLSERDRGVADRIGGRDGSYHSGVAQRFDRLAAGEPDRFMRIAGEGSQDEVHARVWAAISGLIETARG